ncbi:MAG: hypothetical protein AAFU85_11725 [Planctomycetota bacterium]
MASGRTRHPVASIFVEALEDPHRDNCRDAFWSLSGVIGDFGRAIELLNKHSNRIEPNERRFLSQLFSVV